MARMYEMNLMIRLQDRASARMRRIASDMNAMSRHAQQQNKMQALRTQLVKSELDLAKKHTTEEAIRNRHSEVYNRNLSARASAEARLLTAQQRTRTIGTQADRQRWASADKAGKAAMGYTKAQEAALYRLVSAQANLNATTAKQVAERRAINEEIIRETALLHALNAEIAARAPIEARSASAAKLHSRGRTAAHVGSLGFMGGAVTLGAAGVAAGSFAKFDVQAAKAATQVGDTSLRIDAALMQTRKATKELETALLGLAKKYPQTAEELAAASYNIFSSMELGAKSADRLKNGLAVLDEAAQAAVAGQVDLKTSTDTLITVYNDFSPSVGGLHRNMAELFSIVRFMRGGFAELGAGMNKLAPAAKQAQQSLLEVGAAFAVVTQAIPSAAQASTAEARLLDLFGSNEFIKGMKRAGEAVTFVGKNGAEQLKPLSEIMDHIVALDPTLQLGGPKLTNFVKEITRFGSETGKGGTKGLIQMQRALTVLITQHQKHHRILEQATEDTVEYDKSYQILAETADNKWKTAVNNMKVAWIQFGQSAMPTLITILDLLKRGMDYFNGLSADTRKWIGLAIVVIGLLGTIGGLMASAFGGVMMVVATRRMATAAKALEAISTGAVPAITKVSKLGTLLRGLGALGAVVITVEILLHWKSRNQTFTSFDEAAISGIKKLRDKLGGAANPATAIPLTALQGIFELDKWQREAATRQEKARNAAKAQEEKGADEIVQNDKKIISSGKSKLDKIIEINNASMESAKKQIAWEKRLAKATIAARQSALAAQKQDIESAAKFMMNKYKELQAANESAIGGILGGPISGGPILSAFDQINKTLMGVGVKPIKVPLQFIMQDATKQLENFDLWRGGLKTLAKKLPPEMVNELRAAGIDKLPEILSLADAGPAFIKEYVKVWKDTKTARDQATDADMKSTLKLWNSYGKDVAWQIVNGLIDSGAEAKLYEGFTKMITRTFAGQLTASMNKAVADAIKDWKEANPPPKSVNPPTQKEIQWATGELTRQAAADAYAKTFKDNQWELGNPGVRGTAGPTPPFVKVDRGPLTAGDIQRGTPRISFRAGGGIIGGSGTGDTVPAWLTPGELVLNHKQIANAARLLGTGNSPHSVFNKVQHFDGGGVAEGYGTAAERRANYDKFVKPTLNKKKKSRLSRFMGYGIDDALKDADEIQSHVSGIHTKTFLKTYTDAVGVAKLSPSQQRESRAFAEGVMAFHGVGGGLAKNAVGGVSTRGAVSRTALAKSTYMNSPHVVMGISPGHARMSTWGRGDAIGWKPHEYDFNATQPHSLYGPGLYLSNHQTGELQKSYMDKIPEGMEGYTKSYHLGARKDGWTGQDLPEYKFNRFAAFQNIRADAAEALNSGHKLAKVRRVKNTTQVPNTERLVVEFENDAIQPHVKGYGFRSRRNLHETRPLTENDVYRLNRIRQQRHPGIPLGLRTGMSGRDAYLAMINEFQRYMSNTEARWKVAHLMGDAGFDSFSYDGGRLIGGYGMHDALVVLPGHENKLFPIKDPKWGSVPQFSWAQRASRASERLRAMKEKNMRKTQAAGLLYGRNMVGTYPMHEVLEVAMGEAMQRGLVGSPRQTFVLGVGRGYKHRDKMNEAFASAAAHSQRSTLSTREYVAAYLWGARNPGITDPALMPQKWAKGGWVRGQGNNDTIPAFLTPGEYVVSKPMINALTNKRSNSGSTTNSNDIHVTVQATNPTEKSILDALKPVLFSLRHSR